MSEADFKAGYERGKADGAREQAAKEKQVDERDLAAWLLWCRENRFRVREIQKGDVRLVIDDLGDKPPPAGPQPRSVHEAFAKQFGLEYSEDDDGEDKPDPVEGQT